MAKWRGVENISPASKKSPAVVDTAGDYFVDSDSQLMGSSVTVKVAV